jgi:hypothetical protein
LQIGAFFNSDLIKIEKMKKILILLIAFYSGFSFGQEKYFTKTGHAYFMSHTDVIDIDGNNNQAVCFLNTSTGELAIAMLVKSFEFTLATAAEHFNETYMESHLFPKANFKGKISDIKAVNFSKAGVYKVTITGDLTIHGVTKSVTEAASLEVKEGEIFGMCNFSVAIDDYSIKVPKVVEHRVAKVVDVKVTCSFKPYSK